MFDIYDLREAEDKHAFMERMVTDPEVTHVLVFSDRSYAEKADNCEKGLGTESPVISKELYEKVKSSKFIPIVCEVDENGTEYVPTFLKSRHWIDFSTARSVDQNWQQLIRVLFGMPL